MGFAALDRPLRVRPQRQTLRPLLLELLLLLEQLSLRQRQLNRQLQQPNRRPEQLNRRPRRHPVHKFWVFALQSLLLRGAFGGRLLLYSRARCRQQVRFLFPNPDA